MTIVFVKPAVVRIPVTSLGHTRLKSSRRFHGNQITLRAQFISTFKCTAINYFLCKPQPKNAEPVSLSAVPEEDKTQGFSRGNREVGEVLCSL